MNRAVCLLSGGQDSTTCLYYALEEYDEVIALSFDYSQRHRVELRAARKIANKAKVPHDVLPVEALARMGAASLTNPEIANVGEGGELNVYAEARGLPPSFVPGRNVLFFGLGAAWAVTRGCDTLVTGVCAQDRAGYPDCRIEFVDAMEATLKLALDHEAFSIDAPLLTRDKAETWLLAAELGVLGTIVEETHTCYEGDRENFHPWGYGCGECGACIERARGFEQFRAALRAR